MELQRVLESIKSGDFRSAMDCIKYLSQSIHDMQTAVLTVQDALAQKVDLVSKLDPLGSSSTTIGSGLVSVPNLIIAADGPDAVQTVMGTNTTFVTDFQSGWQIIINGITATIKTVASDILLTVICADLSTPIFPIESLLTYGIVRPSTTDMLIGEFAFGSPVGETGKIFSGIIGPKSSLRNYGSASDPYDVLTLKYAKNLLAPAIALGLRSIKRDIDTVTGAQINFIGGEIQYSGSVINDLDLMNKAAVTNAINLATSRIYAAWYRKQTASDGTGLGNDLMTFGIATFPNVAPSAIATSHTIAPDFITKKAWVTLPASTSPDYPDLVSDNFYGINSTTALFAINPSAGGYTYLGNDDIVLLVNIHVSAGNSSSSAQCVIPVIMVDEIVKDFSMGYTDDSSDVAITLSSPIKLSKNQTLMVGAWVGGGTDGHAMSISITKG